MKFKIELGSLDMLDSLFWPVCPPDLRTAENLLIKLEWQQGFKICWGQPAGWLALPGIDSWWKSKAGNLQLFSALEKCDGPALI